MSLHAIDRSAAERLGARMGGASLLLATVLFIAVFSYLAATFDYPDVLDRPAAEVLPRLLALGDQGRAVWALYALVPLLLVPTVVGLSAVTRAAAPLAARGATIAGALAAFSMMLGLLRWPSLQWRLATAYVEASPADRVAIAAVFDAANSYLGNFIGEFVGELALNAFFVLAAYALARASSGRRQWLAYAGAAVGLLGFVAMFRNVTTAVSAAAEMNNLVLPVWMAVLGYALFTHRSHASSPPRG
jgi:multisubunit Na+/H+ antiporter MnhG subunit